MKQKPSATPVYQNLSKSKIIQRSPQRRINNITNYLSLLSYLQGKALKFCIKIFEDFWHTNKVFVISLVISKESIFFRSMKHTWPLHLLAWFLNGSKTSDNRTIANTLCSYYSNVANLLKSKSFLLRGFTWMKPSENNLVPPCSEKFTLNEVSKADVYKELNKLKRKKATGLDNLPLGLLKHAASILTKPLTYVINLSIKTGMVPTDWKEAKVVPVYKSGPRSQVDNYIKDSRKTVSQETYEPS